MRRWFPRLAANGFDCDADAGQCLDRGGSASPDRAS
jgi:hypothetical protein